VDGDEVDEAEDDVKRVLYFCWPFGWPDIFGEPLKVGFLMGLGSLDLGLRRGAIDI
jgi:hypothetical protein